MADLNVTLKRATVPMCPECGAKMNPGGVCCINGHVLELGQKPDMGYYEHSVVGVVDAAHALLKCWQDGTFTEMYMSHMNTLRKALTKLENKP